MKKPFNFKKYKKIPLFYWSEIRFTFREKENFGDLLSKYLVEKISEKETEYVHPKKQPWYKRNKMNLLAIGSIIHHASQDSIVWGSGVIDNSQNISKADFRAVRGPQTRDFLLKLGYDCPPIYGDPALLLADYYHPIVKKKYSLGVVPHYHDLEKACEIFKDKGGVKVIDLLTMDVEETAREIMECEKILSTSLHGLIVAHSYGIPAIWIKMSAKIFGNDIKYIDYLESIGMEVYQPKFIDSKLQEMEIQAMFLGYPILASTNILKKLKAGLLDAKPF